MFMYIQFKFSNLQYTDPLYLLKPSMFIQGVRYLALVRCVFDQGIPVKFRIATTAITRKTNYMLILKSGIGKKTNVTINCFIIC